MEIERNESSINSKGGTELVMQGIADRLDEKLLSKFQIIPSRIRELKDDKIRILHAHNLPSDNELAVLKDANVRNKLHKIVWCSNWQLQQAINFLNIPYDDKICVIETPIEPFPVVEKSKEEVRLIYTATPARGLDILVPVFEQLCKKHDNITLDVFSSFKIYGWDARDEQYEPLYQRCRDHPKINYHGFQENFVVREALEKAHIFAYPSIWQECNSRALIEAMSAGCLAIHPNYGGLPDTSGGLTAMYNYQQDINAHANIFYSILDNAIQIVDTDPVQAQLKFVKYYADARFNWGRIMAQWTGLLSSLEEFWKDKDTSVPSNVLFFDTSKR